MTDTREETARWTDTRGDRQRDRQRDTEREKTDRWTDTDRQTDTQRERRQTDTDRQRDRERKQADGWMDGHRQTDRETQRERRQTDGRRQKYRQTDTERESERDSPYHLQDVHPLQALQGCLVAPPTLACLVLQHPLEDQQHQEHQAVHLVHGSQMDLHCHQFHSTLGLPVLPPSPRDL